MATAVKPHCPGGHTPSRWRYGCCLLRHGRRCGRFSHGAVRAHDHGLHPAGTTVRSVRIINSRHGTRRSWYRPGRRRDRATRHRRHGKLFLARHDTFGLRLIPILKPFIYQLVLVRKFLATSLLRRFLHRPAVGLHDGRLAAAHGPAALLIGKGKSTAEGDGAEQGAAHHVDAAAAEAEFARRLGLGCARSHELAFIEEIGIALIALIEVLRRALRRHLIWIMGPAERDLWRLFVTGVERLQRLMRRQRTHAAGRRREIIVSRLIVLS